MGYGLAYRMKFMNREEQPVTVKIYDTLTDASNNRPYGINYTATLTAILPPAQYQLFSAYIEISWTGTLPGDVTGVTFQATHPSMGGAVTQYVAGTNNPMGATLSPILSGSNYSIILHRPGGDETIDLSADNVQYVDITPAGVPLTISVIDNDEDHFKTIRAKQAVIRFLSDFNFTLSIFAKDKSFDFRYYVEIDIAGRFIFKGYLMLDDVEEPYLTPSNEVTLTASDKLGTLKDIALVDDAGKNPRGHKSLITFISYCLARTGLQLPIYVVNNIKEYSYTAYPDKWFINSVFIDSKTFEKAINESESCYQVLEKILGENMYITQEKGAWWIRRVSEIQKDPVRVFEYDAIGTYVATHTDVALLKTIDKNGDVWLSNKATMVSLNRPHRFVKETYNYDYPKEIICNINYERGDRLGQYDYQAVIHDDASNNDVTHFYEASHLDCWDLIRGVSPALAPTTVAYIRRDVQQDTGRVLDRLIEIKQPPSSYDHYLHSELIPVRKHDRIAPAVDVRWISDIINGTYFFYPLQVRLYGDDGTHWTLNGGSQTNPTVEWVQSNADWSSNNKYMAITGTNDDAREWHTAAMYNREMSPDIPVDGKLGLVLCYNQGTADCSIQFSNIRFDYFPYINGSYRTVTAQYWKQTQLDDADKYNATRERDVYISDSPTRLYKGALKIYAPAANEYVLAGLFYDDAKYPQPTPVQRHPYGYIQAQDVFNIYNRITRTLRITAQGIDSDQSDMLGGADIPGVTQAYVISDSSTHNNDKTFMLLSFEMDVAACAWTGVIKEINDDSIGVVEDVMEFKYVDG